MTKKELETELAYLEKTLQEIEKMPKEDYTSFWQDKLATTRASYVSVRQELEALGKAKVA